MKLASWRYGFARPYKLGLEIQSRDKPAIQPTYTASGTQLVRWNKLVNGPPNLQKGAYVEVEGELRYGFTPAGIARSMLPTSMLARSCCWTAPRGSRASEAVD